MLSKNQIKYINSLKQKKYREEHQLFIAEGTKIVSELLQSSLKVKQIYATSEFLSTTKIDNLIESHEVKNNELERITSLITPNEVLAICEIPTNVLVVESLKNKLTLILDDIKDPGNLGTIIRIADWFGIETIICSSQTADVYNTKVVQATMGSIARIKIHYCDLIKTIDNQQSSIKLRVYGALLEGESIYNKKLTAEGFIIIGNESRGISAELMPFVTDKIKIPSFANVSISGEAESLNAAIATAIICSEFRRR